MVHDRSSWVPSEFRRGDVNVAAQFTVVLVLRTRKATRSGTMFRGTISCILRIIK